MPTIVIASPKGGAGKSTIAVLLSTELAAAGADVTLLDCDPNKSASMWAGRAPLPARIAVRAGTTEASVIRDIRAADGPGRIVIVDLEGAASRLMSRAISQSDLVITPMRPSTLDATIGARALHLVAEEEEALGRTIEHAVVLTSVKAVKSRAHREIEASLIEAGVAMISPPLLERGAYAALFATGGDLRTMPPQGNQAAAIVEAGAFAQAVYRMLTTEREGSQRANIR